MQKTGEWGDFFSPAISDYGYNESLAQDYYPLAKEEALGRGFQWSDYESKVEAKRIIDANMMPSDIASVDKEILNSAIKCSITGRLFKIVEPEYEFYKKNKLPIPRKHPDQRHWERIKMRNPYRLWDRECGRCKAKVQSSYAPDRPEIIYCEKCYLETII
jgi:hypothetical protein